jgi:hypothetical protein
VLNYSNNICKGGRVDAMLALWDDFCRSHHAHLPFIHSHPDAAAEPAPPYEEIAAADATLRLGNAPGHSDLADAADALISALGQMDMSSARARPATAAQRPSPLILMHSEPEAGRIPLTPLPSAAPATQAEQVWQGGREMRLEPSPGHFPFIPGKVFSSGCVCSEPSSG